MSSHRRLLLLLVQLHCYGCLQGCICPEELPYPGKMLGVNDSQNYCGRELNYITNSTDCGRDIIYSCMINTTTPVQLWDCPNQSDSTTPFCSPNSVKGCYSKYLKGTDWGCVRQRTCQNKRFIAKDYKEEYGVVPP